MLAAERDAARLDALGAERDEAFNERNRAIAAARIGRLAAQDGAAAESLTIRDGMIYGAGAAAMPPGPPSGGATRPRDVRRAAAAEGGGPVGVRLADDRDTIIGRVERLAQASAAQDAAASETLPGAAEWAALLGLFMRLESTLSRWNAKQRSAAWIAMRAEKSVVAATLALIANEKEAGATTRARRAAEKLLRLLDGGEIGREMLALAASDIAAYGTLMRGAQDAG